MAILKHLAVHNRFYQDAVTYFLFQHDDHARPIYNAQHKKILRENVLIDAIYTEVWSYSTDCQLANQRWGKNRDEKEVKSHHIIISFPKEDRDEHGLTMELAQKFGMEFARKHSGDISAWWQPMTTATIILAIYTFMWRSIPFELKTQNHRNTLICPVITKPGINSRHQISVSAT